jgi:hypothetical protein
LGDGGTEEEEAQKEGADAVNTHRGTPGDAEPGAEGEEEKEFEFEDVAAGFGDEVDVIEIKATGNSEESDGGEGGEADGGGGLPAAQEEGSEQEEGDDGGLPDPELLGGAEAVGVLGPVEEGDGDVFGREPEVASEDEEGQGEGGGAEAGEGAGEEAVGVGGVEAGEPGEGGGGVAE